MCEQVRVYEVSPRDGLQNEKTFVSTDDKIQLVDLISAAGFSSIEVTSFVSPRWVPQMADATDVMRGVTRVDGTIYGALTPNVRGLENALEAGASEVAVFIAASETFSQKNTNCTIDVSFSRVEEVVKRAEQGGIPVRGYVSCVLGCPYEGEVKPHAVATVSERLLEYGCYEVSLGDTIGQGTPHTTSILLNELVKSIEPALLAGHFHDTHRRAIENVRVALDVGLRTFDSAMAGLGGCPYAPGASGNVDTRLLVEKLTEWGYDTGIDELALRAAGDFAEQLKFKSALQY